MGQPWAMEAEEPERTFSVNDARAFLVTRAKAKGYWAVGDLPYQVCGSLRRKLSWAGLPEECLAPRRVVCTTAGEHWTEDRGTPSVRRSQRWSGVAVCCQASQVDEAAAYAYEVVAGKINVLELYSVPRVCAQAENHRLVGGSSLDLRTGYDFNRPLDRSRAWQLIFEQCPDLVITSPPCTAFSVLQMSNYPRMEVTKAQAQLREALGNLRRAMQVFSVPVLVRTLRPARAP